MSNAQADELKQKAADVAGTARDQASSALGVAQEHKAESTVLTTAAAAFTAGALLTFFFMRRIHKTERKARKVARKAGKRARKRVRS